MIDDLLVASPSIANAYLDAVTQTPRRLLAQPRDAIALEGGAQLLHFRTPEGVTRSGKPEPRSHSGRSRGPRNRSENRE